MDGLENKMGVPPAEAEAPDVATGEPLPDNPQPQFLEGDGETTGYVPPAELDEAEPVNSVEDVLDAEPPTADVETLPLPLGETTDVPSYDEPEAEPEAEAEAEAAAEPVSEPMADLTVSEPEPAPEPEPEEEPLPPVAAAVTTSPRNTAPSGGNAAPTGTPKCWVCSRSVYAADNKVVLDGKYIHKACFRCQKCRANLTLNSFTFAGDEMLCKACFMKRFNETNSYGGDERYTKASTTQNKSMA